MAKIVKRGEKFFIKKGMDKETPKEEKMKTEEKDYTYCPHCGEKL